MTVDPHLSPLLVRACLALALVAAGWAAAQDGQHTVQTADTPEADTGAFQPEMGAAMRRMMYDMHRPSTGDPDRDFLAMMIPHHQGAVDMARVVLVHGRDPLTRQLAEQILATQSIEMEAMRGRLAGLLSSRGEVEYPTLGGTRGENAPHD